jgi:hypothetical protein
VADEDVDGTLPFLSRHIRGLVEFQRHTGCRPGEACLLRWADIEQAGTVWYFRPKSPKGYARWDVNGAFGNVIRTYLSPSDPTVTTGQSDFGALWALASYAYNFQVFGNGRMATSLDVAVGNPNTTNIGFWFGRTRLSAIGDGTSNTIMFAEKIAQCGRWQGPVDGASLWSCEFNQRRPGFAINGASATSTGPASLFQVRPDLATCDWHRASTPSGDAILVALCDGSARSVGAGTAPGIWWSALQPNDGGNLGSW